MKDLLKYGAGLVMACALLAYFLRGVDRAALLDALAAASISGVLLGAMVNLAHNVFRTWRWGALLEPVHPGLRFRPMFTAIIIGYLTTWVLPGRLGELVRPALLSAKEDVPVGPSLGSVVADRVLDGAAILVLFAAGAYLTPVEGTTAQGLKTAAAVLLVLVVGFMAAVVLAGSFRVRLQAWFETRRGVVRWTGRMLLSVASGTEALRRPVLLARIVALSVLAWLTIALGTWIGVRSARAEVPFSAILVMLPILAFGVAVPTPGGAGGYHVAMKSGLTGLFGVPDAPATAAGILMHLAVVLPVIVLGPVLLRTERVSWHDLLAAARKARSIGAEAPAAMAGTSPAEDAS